MKRPVLYLLPLALWACQAEPPPPHESTGTAADAAVTLGTFRLTTERPAIVDGDTIRVEGLDNSLRLVGIDTEETFRDDGQRTLCERNWTEYLATVNAGHSPERPPKYGTPMGEAAKRFAEEFFSGLTEVRLEHDHPTRQRGYFDRHLVHVFALKNARWVNYNVEVVRLGFSPYYKKYGRCQRYHDAFVAAEREARSAGRGIWAKEPPYHCYPDYAQRLRWWADRDRDIARITALSKDRNDFMVLGDDDDWKRLEGCVGRKVTVAGSVSSFRQTGGLGILYLGHRKGSDFAIVGPRKKMNEHPLRKVQGDFVLVTGTVSLYKGRPQFQEATVSWKSVSDH